MSFSSGPIFTSAGRELHARAIAGAPLTFTRMEMGDGSRGSAPIENLTALVHSIASVNISSIRHSGNFATIVGVFTNAVLAVGFNWNEIGLFAADPDYPNDRNRDILYCYQDAAGNPDYIPASNSELITKRISIAAIVSNASNVSATLSPVASAADVSFDNTGTGLAAEDVQAALVELAQKGVDPDEIAEEARKVVEEHDKSQDAHKDLLAKKADLINGKVPADQLDSITVLKTATLTATGWTMGADGRYTQTVGVEGVTEATPLVIVDCNLTTNDTDAKVEFLAAWSGPSANEVTQGAGTLTFYTYELPAVSIPIFVGVA